MRFFSQISFKLVLMFTSTNILVKGYCLVHVQENKNLAKNRILRYINCFAFINYTAGYQVLNFHTGKPSIQLTFLKPAHSISQCYGKQRGMFPGGQKMILNHGICRKMYDFLINIWRRNCLLSLYSSSKCVHLCFIFIFCLMEFLASLSWTSKRFTCPIIKTILIQ